MGVWVCGCLGVWVNEQGTREFNRRKEVSELICNLKSQIANRKSPFGFTLIELVVVIGVVAVLAAVTLPAVNRLSEGNRNVSCQVNMHALYEAIKMYRLDEAGYPPYDPTASARDDTNPGLWALHVYGARVATGATWAGVPDYSILLSSPTARYIRGAKSMHCPDHSDSTQYLASTPDPNRYTDPNTGCPSPGCSVYFNFPYLSYQFKVPTTGQPWSGFDDNGSDDARYTYDVNHPEVASTDPNYYRRQLFPQPVTTPNLNVSSWYPNDNTVITWCVHHRQYTREGTDQDNVLFLDGSVERLPVKQTCGASTLYGWKRLPDRECP